LSFGLKIQDQKFANLLLLRKYKVLCKVLKKTILLLMPFQEIKGDDFCIQLMVWVFSLFEILPWMLAIIHQPFIDCRPKNPQLPLIYPENRIKFGISPYPFCGGMAFRANYHFLVFG